MFALKREAGYSRVIECRLIERTQLALAARVLNVTRHTVSFDIAVHAGPPGDTVGHRLVTRQAFLSRNPLPSLVALLTIGDSLQVGVRPRQRTGRQQRSELCFGARAGDQDHRRGQPRKSSDSRYHLNGTYPRYMVTPTCATTMTSRK
jgi:hypothetical protein